MACEKKGYVTRQHADLQLAEIKRKLILRAGKGSDQKFLEAYRCRLCGLWHLGRSFKTQRELARPVKAAKPAPAPKAPSFGELRRKVAKMARQWERQDDYERRQRAAAIERLIEAERSLEESKAEYARIAREVADYFLGPTR